VSTTITTSFKFETAPLPTGSDPTAHRRARLIERLREQAQLATDPAKNVRVVTRNKKGSGPVEHKQIIRPTWRLSSGGKILFWMKGGAGKVEVAPGHHAIVVAAPRFIPAMIDALVERVSAGEFDSQLVGRKVEKKKANVVQHPANNKKRGWCSITRDPPRANKLRGPGHRALF
jgi:hypothetical protein